MLTLAWPTITRIGASRKTTFVAITTSLLLFIGNLAPSVGSSTTEPRPLIIDTDGGGDDAFALISLLLSQRSTNWNKNSSLPYPFKIVAVTCSYGNTELENVERNVLTVLDFLNIFDVPVYSGARRPLVRKTFHNHFYYYGKNGFGDVPLDRWISGDRRNALNTTVAAHQFLLDASHTYSGRLNVLVLGPTTNVATAMIIDSTFVDRVQRFYVMGGSVLGNGNIVPGVEYNFAADPESNYLLFTSKHRHTPPMLVPWDTNILDSVSMEWRRNTLGAMDSNLIRFLNDVETVSMPKTDEWMSTDTLTALIMLSPDIVTRSVVRYVEPVSCGELRGGITVDFANLTGTPINAEIVLEVDVERFKKELVYLVENYNSRICSI